MIVGLARLHWRLTFHRSTFGSGPAYQMGSQNGFCLSYQTTRCLTSCSPQQFTFSYHTEYLSSRTCLEQPSFPAETIIACTRILLLAYSDNNLRQSFPSPRDFNVSVISLMPDLARKALRSFPTTGRRRPPEVMATFLPRLRADCPVHSRVGTTTIVSFQFQSRVG